MLGSWTGWYALRHGSWPRRFPDRLRLLPVLDLLHPDFTLNQLVHVGDDHRALNIHESERRCGITAATFREQADAASAWWKTAYPLNVPIHAPVAEPGFTKNRPSYSTAWNLCIRSATAVQETERGDSRVRVSRYEDVYIQLPRNGIKRVQVARWDRLVSMYDANPDRRMGNGHR